MQEVQGETVRGDEIEERDPDVFDLFEEVDHAVKTSEKATRILICLAMNARIRSRFME